MRVGIFVDSYKPYISGVTNSVEILSAELRLLGHTVYIIAPNYPNAKNDPNIIRVPSVKTSYKGFRIGLPFAKNIPELDIIHIHSPFTVGLLGKWIAHKRKIPVVYTLHTFFTRYTHYAKFIPKSFAKNVVSIYIKNFANIANSIIVPSTMAKRWLVKIGVKSPIEVIPTGICHPEPVEGRKKNRSDLEIPADAKVLIYTGRISKEKNIDFIINSFKKLREKNSSLYLIIVGGGPLLKSLVGQKEERIVFTGEIPHSQIFDYYSASDIFLFASQTETQGLVLAEAKSAGLPVVATFAGALIDSVRSGIDGFLTKREVLDFNEKIELLLNSKELYDKFSKACIEDVQANFASTYIAKRIETLYNSQTKISS